MISVSTPLNLRHFHMRENIKTLRPQIPAIETEQIKTPLEQFHHEVLRPILKFQNEIILEVFLSEMRRFKIDLGQYSPKGKKEKIKSALQKNQKLRTLLIGIVIALFELDELNFYHQHQSEINKRISNMLEERIVSQLT